MRCALSLLVALAAAPLAAEDLPQAKMDCRRCHTSDTPTAAKPALRKCPRKRAPRIHKLEEAKETLKFDGGDHGPVAFSHRAHAAMAEMDGGCASCHHYMESRPIERCAACHSAQRKREDVGKPDAKAALHRLCIECHRALRAEQGECSYCHAKKPSAKPRTPSLPNKLTFKSAQGKVTFAHAAHVKDFGVACATCHKQESCAACHGAAPAGSKTRPGHDSCFACHGKDECVKCHAAGP